MTEPRAPSNVVAEEVACLDGRIGRARDTAISVLDEGFIRGDGVFEVIRVYEGRPFALAEHLDRLSRSAKNLRLGYEIPRDELAADIDSVLADRGASGFDGCLRVVLTRGGRRLVVSEPRSEKPGVTRLGLVTYAPTRVLDGVKSLSYAPNMLASRLAQERGFDEALLVTPHGRVLEAPTASLFWVASDGVLSTPPLSEHILASITRDRIMQLVEVRECHVSSDELARAREAFLTSTTREVQAVAQIEDHVFEAPGPRTAEVAAALREHIEACLG